MSSPILQLYQVLLGLSDIHLNIRKIIHMDSNVRDDRIYIHIGTFNINYICTNQSEKSPSNAGTPTA